MNSYDIDELVSHVNKVASRIKNLGLSEEARTLDIVASSMEKVGYSASTTRPRKALDEAIKMVETLRSNFNKGVYKDDLIISNLIFHRLGEVYTHIRALVGIYNKEMVSMFPDGLGNYDYKAVKKDREDSYDNVLNSLRDKSAINTSYDQPSDKSERSSYMQAILKNLITVANMIKSKDGLNNYNISDALRKLIETKKYWEKLEVFVKKVQLSN